MLTCSKLAPPKKVTPFGFVMNCYCCDICMDIRMLSPFLYLLTISCEKGCQIFLSGAKSPAGLQQPHSHISTPVKAHQVVPGSKSSLFCERLTQQGAISKKDPKQAVQPLKLCPVFPSMKRGENDLRASSFHNWGLDFLPELGSKSSTNITTGTAGAISNCRYHKIKKSGIGSCKLVIP